MHKTIAPLFGPLFMLLPVQACLVSAVAAKPAVIAEYQEGYVGQVVISPDGKTLVIGQLELLSGEDVLTRPRAGKVLLWDIASRKILWTLDGTRNDEAGLRGNPIHLAFSPNGKWLAVAGSGISLSDIFEGPGNLVLLNAATGELERELVGHIRQVKSVVFGPQSTMLASINGGGRPLKGGVIESVGEVRLWEIPSGVIKKRIPTDDVEGGLSLSPDGRLLAVGHTSAHPWISIKRLTGGQDIDLSYQDCCYGMDMAFSSDGKLFAAANRVYDSELGKYVDFVAFWSTKPWKHFRLLETNRGIVDSIAFSPDGRYLVASNRGGSVTCWDTKSWKELTSVQRPCNYVDDLGFSADGSRLVMLLGGETDKKVRWTKVEVWDFNRFMRQARVGAAPSPDP